MGMVYSIGLHRFCAKSTHTLLAGIIHSGKDVGIFANIVHEYRIVATQCHHTTPRPVDHLLLLVVCGPPVLANGGHVIVTGVQITQNGLHSSDTSA